MAVDARVVSLQDIHEAARRIRAHILATPVLSGEAVAGPGIWLKAESLQRTGSFKVRGAVNAVLQLTPEQRGVAQNLTIGETTADQSHGGVMGFLCDGVVTRVSANNIRRADDFCRTCVVAWWKKTEVLIPALAAGGVTTVIVDQPEPSPSRP